jgi:uridine kinase
MNDSGNLPFPPAVLGIAGCSGSGKTTLAHEIARALGGTHFPLDHYYRDLQHLSHEERCRQNFDDPAILESELLAKHVAALAEGRAIDRHVYDFATHSRLAGKTERIHATHLLIVEGIFALYYPELLPLYNLRIYVDAPDPICYERRVARDVRERGRTAESVAIQYAATVRPSGERYVRPSAANAELIVDGTAALDWSVEQVLKAIRDRGLLIGYDQNQR